MSVERNNMEALYTRYRPSSFGEMVGQDAIRQTLYNQIRKDSPANAYVFAGPRGTGKTTAARIFAKALCCTKDKPCMKDKCPSCMAIENGTSPDIVELDAASNNGVDDIRMIIDNCQYKPKYGKYCVYILDEAHMLSTAAFNAFLKTLEEPPEHVVFMLLTTEKQKLPSTIISRCQFYQFKMISKEDMVKGLYEICMKEFIIYDEGVLEMLADKSGGAMRDAITMLEQCVSLGRNRITKQVVRDMLGEPEEECLENLFTFIKAGRTGDAIDEIDEMYYSGIRPYSILESFFEHVMDKVRRSSSTTFMTRLLRITAETMSTVKSLRQDNKTSLEVAVVKMCLPEMETDLGSLLLRVQKLERGEKSDINVTANAVDPNEFMVIRLTCNPLKTVIAM